MQSSHYVRPSLFYSPLAPSNCCPLGIPAHWVLNTIPAIGPILDPMRSKHGAASQQPGRRRTTGPGAHGNNASTVQRLTSMPHCSIAPITPVSSAHQHPLCSNATLPTPTATLRQQCQHHCEIQPPFSAVHDSTFYEPVKAMATINNNDKTPLAPGPCNLGYGRDRTYYDSRYVCILCSHAKSHCRVLGIR